MEPSDNPATPVESTTPWYSNYELDEETVGYIQTKGFDDPVKVLDSYRNLEKFKGVDEKHLIRLPEDELPENMGDIWNRLGRPESPDGYEIEAPDNFQVDNERVAKYQQIAHEAGISNSAFKKLFGQFVQDEIDGGSMFERTLAEQRAQQENNLKHEWGPKYDESLFLAEKGAREIGLSEDAKEIIIAGMGYDGAMKTFRRIAEALGEKAFVEGERPSDFGRTPEMARYEKEQIMQRAQTDDSVRKQFAAMAGPDYARYKQLMEIIHSEKSA